MYTTLEPAHFVSLWYSVEYMLQPGVLQRCHMTGVYTIVNVVVIPLEVREKERVAGVYQQTLTYIRIMYLRTYALQKHVQLRGKHTHILYSTVCVSWSATYVLRQKHAYILCINVYTHIKTYVCMYTHTRVCVHTYIHTHTHTYTPVYPSQEE